MNVAFICDPHQLCNKHIALEVSRNHNLVAFVYPRRSSRNVESTIARVRQKIRLRGLPYLVLQQAGNRLGWNEGRAFAEAEKKLLRDVDSAAVPFLVHEVADINSPEAIELIKGLKVEAVMCHGGPIYREGLIRSIPLMLNFHTGVSPLYNGASTILFAFANGHPHLCGGTLMTMNPVVDGGDILAHFLPSIEMDDTPATLFFKSTIGAAVLFSAVLSHVEKTGGYTALPQTPPLFYFRSADWTVYQSLRVSSLLRKGIPKRYLREAEAVEYFSQPSGRARHLFASKMLELLGVGHDEDGN
jgi:folate-dependent phosphoribosylglycinamide formyltransferase PurN